MVPQFRTSCFVIPPMRGDGAFAEGHLAVPSCMTAASQAMAAVTGHQSARAIRSSIAVNAECAPTGASGMPVAK